MKTYETQLMIQKEGREPARLCFLDIEAASEQEALDKASAAVNKNYDNVCAELGFPRDETTRIWAELA